jgi:hypothetical protein
MDKVKSTAIPDQAKTAANKGLKTSSHLLLNCSLVQRHILGASRLESDKMN